MAFLVVYISEAHALDGASPNTSRGAPLVEEPITFAERYAVAGKCMIGLSLSRLPAVVDGIDNKVNQAYQAGPDRMYLVGKDGKIAYAGGRGPRGFRPSELEQAIKKELGLLPAEEADSTVAPLKKGSAGRDSPRDR